MGRACVNHYRLLKRQCVFSHDELLCQIAENSGAVDITLAQHVYDDLHTALKNEQKYRSKLIEQVSKFAMSVGWNFVCVSYIDWIF